MWHIQNRFTLRNSYVLKPKSKGWATLTTAKPSNLKDTLNVTNEEQTSRRRHLRYANEQSTHHFWLCLSFDSAPFCCYFTPCLPAQLRRRDHSLFSVALKREDNNAAWLPDFFSCTACAQRHWHRQSHALIYFRKISSYWLWLRTLNSNNANYYVFGFLQQEFITFIILNYSVLPIFLLQIYKITLKTSGQYGNMNRLRIKRCMQ